MPDQLTTQLSVTYTPPKAAQNSGQSTLGITSTYNGQSVGTVDVPPGTTPPTTFAIPFGSVSAAKACIIRNDMSSDIGIRLNSAVADNFELGSGGELMITSPIAPSTTPLISVDILTTADPTSLEQVFFWVYGD